MPHPRVLIAPVALALATLPACAGGFAIHEQSAAGLGNAYAGAAATAEDAATVYYNPAGLVRLGPQWQLGASYIDLSARFKTEASETWLVDRASGRIGTEAPGGLPIGAPLSVGGSDGGQGGRGGVAPQFFHVQPLNEQLSFGFGLYAPFGAETRFSPDWAGRYSAIDTEMAALALNPALAIKLNQHWALGLGLDAIRVNAKVTKALDFHYEAMIGAGLTGTAVPVLDGLATLRGDGWGFGADAGLHYQNAQGLKFGITVRSAVTPKLKGSYRVEIPTLYSQLAAGLGMSLESETQHARADFKLPWSLGVALDAPLAPGWSLQADWLHRGWSRFDELRARVDNTPDQVQVQRWRDTHRLALGLTRVESEQWRWRVGVAFDQSPVRSATWRSPGTPDSDRVWLAAGLGWNHDRRGRLDLGLAWGKMKDAPVDYTDTAYNRADYPFFAAEQQFRVRGRFDTTIYALSVQYRRWF
ncbi:OmpP1/FadL family transporter [Chitinimonas lacunae]|uniref:OmpP1/FadL family transporter n=1 Tax=Chitinimonas lacunae TaxID=1963018 RepID=A0ABV8MUC1_9NEIS